jgi:hypothetical protein
MSSSVLDDLAGALRAYLAQQFTVGSDQVLAFEAFGIPIDPESLRAPQGAFNPVLVGACLTTLTDKIGQLVDGQFHRQWVASELFGALLGGTVQDPNALDAFGAVKAPAEETYRGASPTFPTKAMPDDWYDTSVTGNWTTGQSVSSESSPPPPTPGVTRGRDAWELRVAAVADRPTLTALSEPTTVMSISRLEDSVAAPSPALAATQVMTADTQSPSGSGLASTKAMNVGLQSRVALTSTPVSAAAVETSPVATQPVRELRLDPAVAVAATVATTDTAGSSSAATMPVEQIMLNPDVIRAVLAGIDNNATSQPVNASSLTLTFDLCPVAVDRDWWSWLLVRMPGWILPPWQTGQLIPGQASEGPDPPPPCGLPSTMLLIKNLQISGWSDTDLQTVSQASSLGPFSFAGGREIVNDTLTAPGMQVFAWVCDVLPSLPPSQAPQ